MVAGDLYFSFAHGEIGMPPIDFYMMMGLPMGGTPPLSTDELDLEMVRRCIEASAHRVLQGHQRCPSFLVRDKVCLGHRREFGGREGLLDSDLPALHVDSIDLLCEE